MKIDFHAHFVPESVVRAAETGAEWHGVTMSRSSTGALVGEASGVPFDLPEWTSRKESLQDRLADLDSMHLDAQVLSIAPRLFRYGAEPQSSAAIARDMNDDLVDRIAEAPSRLRGLAHLPLQDPAASIAEINRVAGRLGIIGVTAASNINGAQWDAPELFPVLEAIQEHDLILFIHPANRPKDPRMDRFHLKNLIGNPLETTFAVAAFTLGGLLDRLADIKVCFAHAGGFAVLGVGRFDFGYNARGDVRAGSAALPSDTIRRLYFDSITFSERALRHVIDTVGASQIFLGSDHPADMGTTDPVGFIEGCTSLDEHEKKAILGRNLEQLIGPLA